MRRISALTVLFFFLSLPFKLSAESSEFLFGVGIHLAQGRNDGAFVSRLIDEGVFNSYRDDLYWSMVEKSPGRLDFVTSLRRLDALIFASSDKAFPMLILGYGNAHYGGGFPLTDEARAGYVEYVRAAAARYGKHVSAFEIWNEWNIGGGNRKSGGRTGDPGKYVELVVHAAQAIRQNAPGTKVICGAVADLDTRWIRAVLDRGLLTHCDGLSVHPYVYSNGRHAFPEDVFRWLDGVAALVAVAPGGAGKKIYVTELGWPTHIGKGGATEDRAAAFLIQSLALARTRDYLAGLWWYELTNGQDDPADRESNFGLYRRNYERKPAAVALETTAGLIRTARFEARGTVGSSGQWVRFGVDGSTTSIIVLWGRNGEREGYCLQLSEADKVFDVRAGTTFAEPAAAISSADSPVVLRFESSTSLSFREPVRLARNGRCR